MTNKIITPQGEIDLDPRRRRTQEFFALKDQILGNFLHLADKFKAEQEKYIKDIDDIDNKNRREEG